MAKVLPLRVRLLADRSEGERVTRFDPFTGESYLADPHDLDELGEPRRKPWPLAGLQIEGQAPKKTELPTSFVDRGVAGGWISLEAAETIHRPGGPPDQPWRVTHTFTHADAIVLHALDGDVRYRIVDNPDKWPERKIDAEGYPDGLGFGGDVRWFYRVELES